jgi:hypothetical protein
MEQVPELHALMLRIEKKFDRLLADVGDLKRDLNSLLQESAAARPNPASSVFLSELE